MSRRVEIPSQKTTATKKSIKTKAKLEKKLFYISGKCTLWLSGPMYPFPVMLKLKARSRVNRTSQCEDPPETYLSTSPLIAVPRHSEELMMDAVMWTNFQI